LRIDRNVVCVNEWMNEWMNQWINEWMNEWVSEWMNEWMNESMNEWMNEWVNEWMNEWINESMNQWMNAKENERHLYRSRVEWVVSMLEVHIQSVLEELIVPISLSQRMRIDNNSNLHKPQNQINLFLRYSIQYENMFISYESLSQYQSWMRSVLEIDVWYVQRRDHNWRGDSPFPGLTSNSSQRGAIK
jgi:hypothetical protein